MNSPELYLAPLFNPCLPTLNWQGHLKDLSSLGYCTWVHHTPYRVDIPPWSTPYITIGVTQWSHPYTYSLEHPHQAKYILIFLVSTPCAQMSQPSAPWNTGVGILLVITPRRVSIIVNVVRNGGWQLGSLEVKGCQWFVNWWLIIDKLC